MKKDKKQPNAETTPLLCTSDSTFQTDANENVTAASPLVLPPTSPPPPPPSNDELSQAATTSNKSAKSRRSKKKQSSDGASTKSGKSKTNKSIRRASIKKKREGPQRTIFHVLFDLLRAASILANIMMLFNQLLPFVLLKENNTVLQVAVRIYMTIFGLYFVLSEMRISILKRMAAFNTHWILRGFMYTFIGLIGMEQALAIKVEDIAAGTASVFLMDYGTLIATLFISGTQWLMIGVGMLYTLLGVLCMQGWYDRLEEEHDEKIKLYKAVKRKHREEAKRKKKLEESLEWFADKEIV